MIEPGIAMVLTNLEVNQAVVPPEDLLLLCLSEVAVQVLPTSFSIADL
jgi:hypothetical protein